MENKMKEFAELLGLELEEEFTIKETANKYKLTNRGLYYYDYYAEKWCHSIHSFERLLLGYDEIIKLPILDDIEKKYLNNVIKPFRKHIITIRKIQNYKYEFIEIVIYSNVEGVSCEVISFPYFNKGKMYKGIEINTEYTLKELGI